MSPLQPLCQTVALSLIQAVLESHSTRHMTPVLRQRESELVLVETDYTDRLQTPAHKHTQRQEKHTETRQSRGKSINRPMARACAKGQLNTTRSRREVKGCTRTNMTIQTAFTTPAFAQFEHEQQRSVRRLISRLSRTMVDN